MPIRRVKNRRRLKASVRLRSYLRPYYLNIYLWKDGKSLVDNTDINGLGEYGYTEIEDATLGCFCSNRYFKNPDTKKLRVKPLLGEIHLISKEWTTEIVAHELQHAILHRMRVLKPHAREVIKQARSKYWKGNSEEDICYDFGKWFDELYSWLWKNDSYGKHAKK